MTKPEPPPRGPAVWFEIEMEIPQEGRVVLVDGPDFDEPIVACRLNGMWRSCHRLTLIPLPVVYRDLPARKDSSWPLGGKKGAGSLR
jgi:hypothetical protein